MESNTRKIKIKTLTNQTYELEFDATQSVSAFKQKLAEVSSVPSDRQRLVFMGKLLLDDQPLNSYIKSDDQTVHLMARTEGSQPVGQDSPAQTQSAGQVPPQPPQPGFNPTVLMNEFNNLTGMVMRSMGNPSDIGNIFNSLLGTVSPGVQLQFSTAPQPPQFPGQPPMQPQAQSQPQSQPQSPPPPPQSVPIVHVHTNVRPPNQPNQQPGQQPHHHHHHQHPHPHQHQQRPPGPPQQSSPSTNVPIVLPFNVLYALGTLITQLNGEGSAFPGPPLPHMGSRNNIQVMGAFLSNWHFQMMRFLPYIFRLGELLQREPAIQDPIQREEVNTLLSRISPILEHVVMSTDPIINIYRGVRLGANPGQFTIGAPPPIQINPLIIPGVQIVQQISTSQAPISQQSPSIPPQIPQFTISGVFQQTVGQNPGNGSAPPVPPVPTLPASLQFLPQNILSSLGIGAFPPGLSPPTGQPPAPTSVSTSVPAARSTNQDASQTQQAPSEVRTQSTSPPQPQQSPHPTSIPPPQREAMSQQLNSVLQSNPMLSSMLNPASIGMVTAMTVRSMLQPEDPNEPESVYSLIFGDVQMSDFMSSITVQNFSYLTTHRQSMRKGVLEAIKRTGSRQALIEKLTTDLCNIVVSEELKGSSMEGFGYEEITREILTKHLTRLVDLILSEESSFEEQFIKSCKKMIGQLIYQLSEGNEQGAAGVMTSLRTSIARQYNPTLMGLAGMAFGLIEGRLVAMYNEHRADIEREKARSTNDIQDEQQLIEAIQRSAEQDREKIEQALKKPHSPFY